MKIICISDTHLHHPEIKSSAEMIIHCGDVTCRGYEPELKSFLQWYSSLEFKYKIMIPGNHDFIFENNWELAKKLCDDNGIICLNDSGIKIEGINIWGSPITPWFHSWAFNRTRGIEIQEHWNKIPENTNILITHGPPSNVGDLSKVKNNKFSYSKIGEERIREFITDVGCENLKNTVERIKPKYHLFGHIHEGYGIYKSQHTTFINCAQLNHRYENVNEPVEFVYESYY